MKTKEELEKAILEIELYRQSELTRKTKWFETKEKPHKLTLEYILEATNREIDLRIRDLKIDYLIANTSNIVSVSKEEYITTSEAAELLNVSSETVRNYVKQGKISYIETLGGHKRYSLESIKKLIK